MQIRSISRELALLLLGQISQEESQHLDGISIETILSKALEALTQHWRDELDLCAISIEKAQQELIDSELLDDSNIAIEKARKHLMSSLNQSQSILNSLSESADLPRFLALSDQKEIRNGAIHRVKLVMQKIQDIDISLDNVMEGWRLKRLPRIDRDILRLAFVDLIDLKTPIAVTCNEAVNLANRYSDDQGRKMINGVLRRFQDATFITTK